MHVFHQHPSKTVSAAFVAFKLVLPFREGIVLYGLNKNVIVVFYLCVLFTNFEHTKLYSFQDLSHGFNLEIFREFQPRCSYGVHVLTKK